MELSPIPEIALAALVAGEANPAQRAEVEAWLELHPDNRLYLAAMQSDWEAMDEIDPRFVARTDLAWERFQAQVQPQQAVVRNIRWQYYAAAAAIALLIGWAGAKWVGQPSSELVPQITERAERSPKELALSDGSDVSLQAEAEIVYPEVFEEDKRPVKLKKGEAYFAVAKDSTSPFTVEAGDVEVKVLGTEFAVAIDSAERQVQVTVAEGQVEVSNKLERVILRAGEQAIALMEKRGLRKLSKPDLNAIAWKTRKLDFKRTPLQDAIERINQLYDTPVRLANPNSVACDWTADFDNESLETVLMLMQETLKIRQETKNDTIIIHANACQ
ncbi:MAG: FecR domain-containing protein [Bacteroidota bacterium]